MQKSTKLKITLIKLLLVPVYALFLCVVIYLVGDIKDIWPKWSAWVDRKFQGDGRTENKC